VKFGHAYPEPQCAALKRVRPLTPIAHIWPCAGPPCWAGISVESRRVTDLLDREDELRVLLGLAEESERGGVARVHGAPGIGKSALLAAVRERSPSVLATAGVPSEAALPYAALERLLRGLPGGAETLPEPQREALLGALGLAGAHVGDPFLVGLATLNLLAGAASGGRLVVLVDDAHWLDEASAEVLAFVARRLEAEPIALIVAEREGARSLPLDAPVDVPLAPLGEAASRALVDRAGLPAATRRRVLELAAGNPLALVELPLTAGRDDGGILPLTDRLEHAFGGRLADLPPAARALVLVAAADDGGAVAEILAAAPGAGESDVEAAVAARLLERDGARLRFRHPLIRSATYQAASEAERRSAHAAVARVVAHEPHRAAWHRAAASSGPDEDVAAALEAAAADARRRGAPGAAARALARAAELSSAPERAVGRLLEAAELSVELGDEDAVSGLVGRAEQLAPDRRGRARIRWIRETFAAEASDDAAPVRSLIADAREARLDGDVELALRLLLAAGTRCWWAIPADAPVRGEVVAETLATGVADDDPRALAVLAATSAVRHAALLVERLERACEQPTPDPMDAHLLGQAAHMVGQSRLAVRQLARVEAQWRAQARLGLLAQALVMRAWSSIQLGNWPAVEPAAAEGDRLARETMQPLWAAGGRAALAAAAGARGDYARGMALAAEAEAQLSGARPTNVFAVLQVARGVTALGGGRHAEAYDQLARMFDPHDRAHHFAERQGGLSYLAEAALHCDRVPEARAVVERFVPLVADTPATLLQIGVAVGRPLVAPSDAAFEEALRDPATRPTFHRARLLLAQGAWLRRERRAAGSRAPLRTARDLFDALGTVPWADRARQELRASGERSGPRAPETRDRLTPQELQIARMAASGLSNPEIGARLFLSARTVASHLYRAFPKLGVASRTELATVLEVKSAG
jgi:DNA-binding CsgD family transcriptional regulator